MIKAQWHNQVTTRLGASVFITFFLFQVEIKKHVTETVVKVTALVLVPQIEPHPTSWQYPIMNYLVSDYRNPNTFGNGSWTSTYWPLYSSYNKEYLSLNIHNKTVGHGVRSRKCAFWHSYLPSLLSKYPTTYNQDFMKQILLGVRFSFTFKILHLIQKCAYQFLWQLPQHLIMP